MITLWTGAPGAGKTADMVDTLRKLAGDGSRPIYAQGVEGLQIPHTELDGHRWHLDVPDGAIVVIDEVQQVWRPRGPGHAPSDAVKALETHRHRGLDFFVTTQKPNLLDANVRGLVGRHVHIRDTGWLGRWKYEWPECSENLAWKTCTLKKRFTLPKKSFQLYKSSSLHTVAPKGKSMMPAITAALILASCLLVFMVYKAIHAHLAPDTAVTAPLADSKSAGPSSQPGAPPYTAASKGAPITAESLAKSFTPRIPGREESSPAYDELRRVVNMPRIVGGYCRGSICVCMDNQNRKNVIPQEQCRAWIASPPFDPYYVADVRPGADPGLTRAPSPVGEPGSVQSRQGNP